MKYEFIHSYRSTFRIQKMCRILQVSRSGYYGWIDRPESKRSQENRVLLKAIKDIHEANKEIYGSPRITEELPSKNIKASRNLVARMMAKNGMRSKWTLSSNQTHTRRWGS